MVPRPSHRTPATSDAASTTETVREGNDERGEWMGAANEQGRQQGHGNDDRHDRPHELVQQHGLRNGHGNESDDQHPVAPVGSWRVGNGRLCDHRPNRVLQHRADTTGTWRPMDRPKG